MVGPALFLLGAVGGHLHQMLASGNFAPGNGGVIFYTDILIPIIGFVLLWLQHRNERAWARSARAAMTGPGLWASIVRAVPLAPHPTVDPKARERRAQVGSAGLAADDALWRDLVAGTMKTCTVPLPSSRAPEGGVAI